MKTAKHIIVEKGQVFTTDKPMPEPPIDPKKLKHLHPTEHDDVLREWYEYHKYPDVELESWKKEAYPVTNQSLIVERFPNLYSKIGIDSLRSETNIYDAPAGLEYEVIEIDSADGTESEQVAILSFASPKEETPASKEKPDFEKAFDKWKTILDRDKGEVTYSWTVLAEMFNDFSEQREQIAALQEEIRQLKNKQ